MMPAAARARCTVWGWERAHDDWFEEAPSRERTPHRRRCLLAGARPYGLGLGASADDWFEDALFSRAHACMVWGWERAHHDWSKALSSRKRTPTKSHSPFNPASPVAALTPDFLDSHIP